MTILISTYQRITEECRRENPSELAAVLRMVMHDLGPEYQHAFMVAAFTLEFDHNSHAHLATHAEYLSAIKAAQPKLHADGSIELKRMQDEARKAKEQERVERDRRWAEASKASRATTKGAPK